MPHSNASKRISGTAYQALRNAIALVFWYKPTLKRYLYGALREHAELLAGIDFNAKKREIADELVDRLIEHEPRYQQATLQLMFELANMTTFPELEQHEDSTKWLPKGRAAVAELKAQTATYEALLDERDRQDAETAAYKRQVELQRRFSSELADLRDAFTMLSGATDKQKRGRRFEDFLNSLFALFDLEPRLGYVVDTDQIDGSISFDTDVYIVEAKWTATGMSRAAADAFAVKVHRRGKNALGLIVSINGLTRAAREAHDHSTPFMTLDGQDLTYVLEGHANLDELLRRKKRHASESGECYFPVSMMYS